MIDDPDDLVDTFKAFLSGDYATKTYNDSHEEEFLDLLTNYCNIEAVDAIPLIYLGDSRPFAPNGYLEKVKYKNATVRPMPGVLTTMSTANFIDHINDKVQLSWCDLPTPFAAKFYVAHIERVRVNVSGKKLRPLVWLHSPGMASYVGLNPADVIAKFTYADDDLEIYVDKLTNARRTSELSEIDQARNMEALFQEMCEW